MLKFCVVTSFDENFRAIGEYAAMTLQYYCKVHGHTALVVDEIELNRPTPWHRIKLIPRIFDEGFDFVFWMDADAVFSRFDRDIRELVKPDKDLFLVQHHNPFYPKSLAPNSGVMLMRNSDWSRRLLSDIWDKTEYIDHPWWENAALLDLLGYHGQLAGEHMPDHARLAKVEFLDESWNNIPILKRIDDPIITHLAGYENDLRRDILPREALKSLYRELGRQAERDAERR